MNERFVYVASDRDGDPVFEDLLTGYLYMYITRSEIGRDVPSVWRVDLDCRDGVVLRSHEYVCIADQEIVEALTPLGQAMALTR